MALKKIKLFPDDRTFIRDGNDDGFGCGTINDDGHLYLIDENDQEAYLLPDCYANTHICLYPSCGGYRDGLIMVSLLGELDLQYHHNLYAASGLWGWIDLEGNEVISPQYVYAMHFWNGRAVVCRGKWSVDENGRYWCENEQWGIIDQLNNEIVPCQYDELFEIDDTEQYVLCHKDGWKDGCNCIYDIERQQEILDLDFDFDNGYMFNSCFYTDGCIFFDEHIPGGGIDYIYVYSVVKGEWIAYREPYTEREYNGQKKMVVQKDGKDIIIF
ncbi:MAG: WG repeat-containing protein [Clostridia bacterium]|nr:WG repeat-containing protein [Clostridia bacterium]